MPSEPGYYDDLKAARLCVKCKAGVTGDAVCCPKCAARNRAAADRWRAANVEAKKKADREFGAARARRRLCMKCGEPSLTPVCDRCRRVMADGHRRRTAGKATAARVCSTCAGAAGQPRHNRQTCPWRFRVDVVAYASARPGAGF